MNDNEYFDRENGQEPEQSWEQPSAPEQPLPDEPQMPLYEVPPVYSAPEGSFHETPSKPPKEKKRKGLGAAVIAIALCCGLLGSVCGGLIVGVSMQNFQSSQTLSEKDAEADEPVSNTVKQDPTPSLPAASQLSDGSTLTPAQVYANNVSAVVGISNESTTYNIFGQVSESASSGSGFIISSDGEILTNYHVIEGAQTLTVTLYDGSEYTAQVLGYEASSDVALIKINAENLSTVTLGNSSDLYVGAEVAAIGNPLGELTYSLNVGYISSMERSVNTDGTPINMMQIDVSINSGNSGGPLFDMQGNVVGINTAKYSGSTTSGTTIEGIGFAIPIDDVKSILDELRENGAVLNRAYIGITPSSVTSSEAQRYNIPLGVYVESVQQGSCGETAGLKRGDIITALDSYEIESYEDLAAALKKYRAGDEAVLTVYRSGNTLTLEIVFDAKPASTTTDEQVESSYNPWGSLVP